MRTHRLLAIVAACAFAAGVSVVMPPAVASTDVSTRPPPPSRAELEKHAREVVASGVPGVEITTHDERRDRTVVEGVGDLRSGAPPQTGQRFRIASVTKTFTAAVVLSLVDDERVRLDAPIGRYLPGLLPYAQQITVRQLLAHRSGLFDYGSVIWANPKLIASSRYRDYSPPELVRIATRRPLQFTPGTDFGYSNTDYVVLGMLVEQITGHDYEYEVWRRVLRPAGLKNTYVAGHDPRLRGVSMQGYEAVRPKARLTNLTTYNMSAAWASGDVVSTADDLHRFYASLLAGHLLPRHLLAQMKQTGPAFPGFEYGLGIGHTQMCGQQLWGHVGGVPGYGTYTFTSNEGARQITVSVNRSVTLSSAAEDAIYALLAAEFCGKTTPR